ncbi:MAG: hypothetical protein MR841_08755 [Lactobacillus johnsonii]|nr:hypothetical protein [Lactobacillus johnsonii]
MNDTDLQKVEQGLTKTIDSYNSIGLMEPDKAKCLGIMQKESSIILNEEKRKEDLAFQKDRFLLEKDHKYFEENLAKEKAKQESKWHDEETANKKEVFEYQKIKDKNELDIQQSRFGFEKDLAKAKLNQESKWHDEEIANKKELFEYQKTKDANDFSIQKLRFDLDRQRLDFEEKDLEFKRELSKSESKYRWITFGVTTILGFAQFAISLYTYKKLAYTNLKLIYCDEGRPTTDYKDAIKNVQNMIKK